MSGFVNKLEVSHPSPESSLPVCLRMSFLPTHLEKSRDKQERRTSLSLASSRGRGRESARGNGTPERGWSADRDRGSSFSTAVHGQGSVAQGRRQGKVWKGSGFSSMLPPIHPYLSSPFTLPCTPGEGSARPRTAGTLSPPIACRRPPTMRRTSIRADAESFTRRRDVTDAMGRLQQQLLGRQSRLHALGQSDASLAAPSMKHVRAPPMMRSRVPLSVSVLSCRRHADLRPALLACHGLTPRPPMNAISHRAWPTAVAREGPGTKVPWVMERCAAHIEQYGLQVGFAPDHPCRLGTLG